MTYDDKNIFARILRGEIPVKRIYESDHVLSFHDAFPKAPVHALIIPKGKYIDMADFGLNASSVEIEDFYRSIPKVAEAVGVHETGFRAIANAGTDSGQEVPHFHVHIIGGKAIGQMVQS